MSKQLYPLQGWFQVMGDSGHRECSTLLRPLPAPFPCTCLHFSTPITNSPTICSNSCPYCLNPISLMMLTGGRGGGARNADALCITHTSFSSKARFCSRSEKGGCTVLLHNSMGNKSGRQPCALLPPFSLPYCSEPMNIEYWHPFKD